MIKGFNCKNCLIKLFLLFVPLTLLLGGILYFIYSTEINAISKIILSREQIKTSLQKQSLAVNFNEIINSLIIIANSHELSKAVNGLDYDIKGLSNDFYQVVTKKKVFDQIRYLDESGMEVVRVNYNKGSPFIVEKEKLQNKSNRYYFQDTLKLKRGEVFISPIDLNIEHGKIEDPLKPMARFATPLYNNNGHKKGVLILNYLADLLIYNLDAHFSKGLGTFSLLNSDGYWLKCADRNKEWGFMYEDKKDLTFQNEFPEVWNEIMAVDTGQFMTDMGLFTFTTFYPLEKTTFSSTGSTEAFSASTKQIEGEQYFYKLVSHISPILMKQKTQRVASKLFKLFAIMVFVLLMLSVMIVLSLENKRKYNEERNKLIEDLQNAIDEVKTLQGIIPICSSCKKIRDGDGFWNQVESYISKHSDAEFSHSVCEECAKKIYGNEEWYKKSVKFKDMKKNKN